MSLSSNQLIIIVSVIGVHTIAGCLHSFDDYKHLLKYEGNDIVHIMLIQDNDMIECINIPSLFHINSN